MRKNKMMRAASALLVATLLTTSVISGTFAKYTTSTTGTDKARVAYWGFNQDATIDLDLFDATYTNVKSENNDNVVAPGTSKTATFAFGYDTNTKANAPEVAYTLNVDAEASGSYTQLDANPNFKWSLTDSKNTKTEYQTVAQLIAAIKELSGEADGSKEYAAGELPTAFTSADETYTVGWDWAYYTDEAGDTKDTAMGNATTLDDVNLTITITATQIN